MPRKRRPDTGPPPEYDGRTELPNPQHELVAFYASTGLQPKEIKTAKGVSLSHVQIKRVILNDTVRARRDWFLRQREKKALLSVEEVDRMLSENLRASHADFVTLTPDGDMSIAYDKDSPYKHAVKKLKVRIEAAPEGSGRDDARIIEIELLDHARLTDLYYKRFGHYPPAKLDIGTDDALSQLLARAMDKSDFRVPAQRKPRKRKPGRVKR